MKFFPFSSFLFLFLVLSMGAPLLSHSFGFFIREKKKEDEFGLGWSMNLFGNGTHRFCLGHDNLQDASQPFKKNFDVLPFSTTQQPLKGGVRACPSDLG